MAFIETSYSINVTVQDKDGDTGTATMYMDGDALFTAVEVVADTFRDTVQALSDGVVTAVAVTKGYRNDQPINPAVGSEVERKGRFTFALSDTRRHTVSVPALRDALVFPGGHLINGNDVNVLALTALVEASGTDAVGTDVVKVLTAKEVISGRNRA